MTSMQINREKLLNLIHLAGFRTQQDFAAAVGLSGPKFTNLLKGLRRPQVAEAQRMADALDIPIHVLLPILGLPHNTSYSQLQHIGGYVDDDEHVTLQVEGSPEFGSRSVQLPFLSGAFTCLEIKGTALAPRYLCGDVIGIGRYPAAPQAAALEGRDAVVKLAGGEVFLKKVHLGSRSNRYTLLSLKPHIAPVLDAELEWAEPVKFLVSAPEKTGLFR
jgi:transcriptional regulator with XRE-family HTH domain